MMQQLELSAPIFSIGASLESTGLYQQQTQPSDYGRMIYAPTPIRMFSMKADEPFLQDMLPPVIVLVPLLGAILVAISRIRDYKHTATQVTWGGIIGIICALFSYHQYYPVLTSRTSHVPYPPRDFSYLVHSENQVPGQYEEEVREELGMSPRSSSSFHDHQQRPWSSQHQQQPSAALDNNGHPYDSQQRYKTSGQLVENGIEGRLDHQQNNVSQPNPEDRTRGYLSEQSNNYSSSSDSPISVTVVGNGQSSPSPLQNQ
ncbi:hypothetical protein BGW41_003629 [Actinomortierella wolfii]|nr:hypothetical protein BGW41_003629 [Actinomortierella wolfii]